MPAAPAEPVGPCAPVGPAEPCGPVGPATPAEPVGPTKQTKSPSSISKLILFKTTRLLFSFVRFIISKEVNSNLTNSNIILNLKKSFEKSYSNIFEDTYKNFNGLAAI